MRFFNKTALKFILGFAGILAVSFLFLFFVGALEWNKGGKSADKTAAPSPQEE